MKIAIYINNENITDIDCINLKNGNPGIGGTEYCILLLAQVFKEYYPEDFLVLIASKKGKFPKVDEVILQGDLLQVPNEVQRIEADFLVISSVYRGKPLPKEFMVVSETLGLKLITWGHNFYLNDFCNLLSKSKAVVANVFVGRQQYDRYIDHRIIHKSTYIYNMYPDVTDKIRTTNDKKTVTYIGSLVPSKGFHLLANAWKDILQQVPEAELHVVGSGKLYDRSSKLGKYGIAEEVYENKFISGITDGQGKILKSVIFHGVLGEEKNDLIARTSIGVPNPSGRTETFGISALDFLSRGVPVVTIGSGGFLDTVINGKTGILYSNPSELAQCVIALLKDGDKNVEYGYAGMEFTKQFAPKQILIQWKGLFDKVRYGEKLHIQMPETFTKNNLKQFRIINRKLKNFLRLEYPFSIIGIETIGRNLLRRMGH